MTKQTKAANPIQDAAYRYIDAGYRVLPTDARRKFPTLIQEEILFPPNTVKGRDPTEEADIRPIAKTRDWRRQREMW